MTDELLDKENPLSAKKNGIRGKTLFEIGKAFESEFSIGSKEEMQALKEAFEKVIK